MSSKLPQETTVEIGGVSYRFSKFTLDLYQEFIEWAIGQLPEPWKDIAEKVKGLPVDLAKHVIDKAEAKAASRQTLNDPEISALAASLPGVKKILSLQLRKHHANLTDAQVEDVLEKGIEEHGEDFFSVSRPGDKGTSTPAHQP